MSSVALSSGASVGAGMAPSGWAGAGSGAGSAGGGVAGWGARCAFASAFWFGFALAFGWLPPTYSEKELTRKKY